MSWAPISSSFLFADKMLIEYITQRKDDETTMNESSPDERSWDGQDSPYEPCWVSNDETL